MTATYPNLELLEYKAKQLLSADPEFIKSQSYPYYHTSLPCVR